MAIKARSVKSNDATLERIFDTYENNFKMLDKRQIAPLAKLSSDATTDDITVKINEIIDALNNSDLTR